MTKISQYLWNYSKYAADRFRFRLNHIIFIVGAGSQRFVPGLLSRFLTCLIIFHWNEMWIRERKSIIESFDCISSRFGIISITSTQEILLYLYMYGVNMNSIFTDLFIAFWVIISTEAIFSYNVGSDFNTTLTYLHPKLNAVMKRIFYCRLLATALGFLTTLAGKLCWNIKYDQWWIILESNTWKTNEPKVNSRSLNNLIWSFFQENFNANFAS